MDESLRQAKIITFTTPAEAIVAFENAMTEDDLEELEADMLNEVHHSLVHDLGRVNPRKHQEVMVFNNAHTQCQRGYILDILPTDTKTVYTVFLYDHALVTKHPGSNIMKLKDRFLAYLPRSNIFRIPGVVPAKLILTDIHGMALKTPYQRKYVEGEKWSEASLSWSLDWAANYEKRTRISVCREIDRIVKIGELRVVDEKGRILRKSYVDFLCADDIAIFNQLKYDSDVKRESKSSENWQTKAQRIGGLLSDAPTLQRNVEPVPQPLVKNTGARKNMTKDEELMTASERKTPHPNDAPIKSTRNLGTFTIGKSKPLNPFLKTDCNARTKDHGLQEDTPANSIPVFPEAELSYTPDVLPPTREQEAICSGNSSLFTRTMNPDNCFAEKPTAGVNSHSEVIMMPDHIQHGYQHKHEHHISSKDAVDDMVLELRENQERRGKKLSPMNLSEQKCIAWNQDNTSPVNVTQSRFPGEKMSPLELARMRRPSVDKSCQPSDAPIADEATSRDKVQRSPIRKIPMKSQSHEADVRRLHLSPEVSNIHQNTEQNRDQSQHVVKAQYRQVGQGRRRNPFMPESRPYEEHGNQALAEPLCNKAPNNGCKMEKKGTYHDDVDSGSNLETVSAEVHKSVSTSMSVPPPNAQAMPFQVALGYTWDELMQRPSSSQDLKYVAVSRPSRGRKSPSSPRADLRVSPKLNPFHPPSKITEPVESHQPRTNPFGSQDSRAVNIHVGKNSECGLSVPAKTVIAPLPQATKVVSTSSHKKQLISNSGAKETVDEAGSGRLLCQPEPHSEIPKKRKESLFPLAVVSPISEDDTFETGDNHRYNPRNGSRRLTVDSTSTSALDPNEQSRAACVSVTPTATSGETVVLQRAVSSFSFEGSNIQRMMRDRVFVYGSSPVAPYTCNQEFPYLKIVNSGLGNLLDKFNSLQRNAIPNILRGRNVFILDNKNNGKSLAYMVPIVARIMAEKKTMSLKDNRRGPVALFVASSLASCLHLDSHMQFLLDSVNKKETMGYTVTQNNRQTIEDLKRGIDIMITTPELLLEMIDNLAKYFSLDRLMYLVCDDLEILTSTKAQVLRTILQKIQHGLHTLAPRNCPLQYVFVSNTWSEHIKNATDIVSDPILICGPIHATMFADVKTIVHYSQNDDQKMENFLNLIGNIIGSPEVNNRVVIACQGNTAVTMVHNEILEKFNKNVHTVMHGSAAGDDDDASPGRIDGVRQAWKTSPRSDLEIIACTDAVVKELLISDALQIIHFDVPDNSDIYAKRFCTMWSRFRSTQHRRDNPSDAKEIISNLFLTSQQKDLLRVVRRLKLQGAKIPPDLEIHFQNLLREEIERSRLCPGIVWHGFCEQVDQRNCTNRHEALPHEDNPLPMIPRTGQIEVRITQVHNPSSYYAQLLKHYEKSGDKTKLVCNYEKDLRDRTIFLGEYYKNEENRIRPKKFEEGVLLAVENDGQYFRAEVEVIVKRNEFKLPFAVALFCLDTAVTVTRYVESDDLFILPKDYETLPSFGIELVLANMKPPSGERCFRRDHIISVNQRTIDTVLVGRICFSIQNRIWVDHLVEMDQYDDGKLYQKRSLRREFFERKYAENNLEHMETLYEMYRKVGVSCKEYDDLKASTFDAEFETTFFQLNDPIQWAHVPTSTKEAPELVTLWSSFIHSIDFIFCYHEKFTDQLDRLSDDLDQEIEKLRETNKIQHLHTLHKYYNKGLVVAAKDYEKWSRAIITDIIEEEGEMFYNIFMVDTGEDKYVDISDLFPMPKKFVSKLPFQAMALKINHVVPALCNNEDDAEQRVWSSEANDLMCEKLLHDGTAQMLKVAAFSKNKETDYPPCKHYNAVVFTLRSGDPYEAGEQLVMENYARFTEDGEELLSSVKDKWLKDANDAWDDRKDDEEAQAVLNENQDLQNAQYNDFSNPDLCENDESEKWDCYYGDQDPLEQFKGLVGEDSHFVQYVNDVMKNLDKTSARSTSKPSSSKDSCSIICKGEKSAVPSSSKLTELASDAMEPNYRKPETVWREVDGDINLRINIPDVKNYKAEVRKDRKSFYFETIDPPGYGFTLNLYKKVESEIGVKLLGSCVKIKLKKRLTKLKWTRLTKDELKPRWLLNDYENMSDSDDDVDGSEKETFSSVSTKHKSSTTRNFINVDYNQDEYSSDSDYLVDVEEDMSNFLE